MKQGTLIVSLDFELFWGMLDCSTLEEYGGNVMGGRGAIPRLLKLFETYNIHATWATVGFLFADNYEVYRYDYIVEEKLSFMGKLIDLGYNINFQRHENSAESEEDKAYEKLMKQYHLPFIPRSCSFGDFCGLLPAKKQRIMTSWYPRYDAQKKRLQAATMSDRKSSRASAANLRNIIRLLGLNENDLAAHYKEAISGEGEEKKKILNNLGRTEHLRWMAFSLLEENSVWKDPVKNETFQRANQTIVYYRHATLVEWDKLDTVDRVFPAGKTFQQKDLEIIENLALVYQEYNVQKTV